MLTGEMAKFQIQDRLREAQAFRKGAASRAAIRAGRGRARRIASHALATVLWPVKH